MDATVSLTGASRRYPAERIMRIMKKFIIIAAAALVVAGGVAGTVIGVSNSPKVVAANAITGAIEDLGKRDEIAPVLNAMNGGSLAVTVEGKDLEDLVGIEDDVVASGKLYMDADKQALMLDDLSFKMGDFSLSGQVYMGNDSIYVANDEILDGAWGVERGSLVKDLSNSILAPDSDSDYALDEEEYELLEEIFDALDNELDLEMQKDFKKVSERYTKKLWKLIGEHAEFEAETDNVRINGERKKARVITVTLDDDAVALIAEGMIEYLLEDDELADLVEKYGDELEGIIATGYDVDDLSKAYDDLLDELEDNMDDVLDSIGDVMKDELVLTIVTPVASSDLLMLTVSYDKTDLVELSFGHEGILKTDCISAKVPAADVDVTYTIKENSRQAYEANLSVNGEKVAELEIDRSKDEFELNLIDACVISGEMSTKGSKTTVVVDSVKVDGERYKNFKVTLVLDESDKMPSRAKDVESILTVDAKDIEKWGEKAEELFDDFMSDGIEETTAPVYGDDYWETEPDYEQPGVVENDLYGTYRYESSEGTVYSMYFYYGSDSVEVTVSENYSYESYVYDCTYYLTTDGYGNTKMVIDGYDCPLEGTWSYETGYNCFYLSGAYFEKQ